jgi:hypothetical protein
MNSPTRQTEWLGSRDCPILPFALRTLGAPRSIGVGQLSFNVGLDVGKISGTRKSG